MELPIHSRKEMIDIAKEAINPEYIRSFFVAGSRPAHVTGKTDIDLFTVTKHQYTHQTLNQLNDAFTQKLNNTATHSFVDGPIKYKHKGLAHLLVYTDNANHPASIYNIPGPILYSWIQTGQTLAGDNLETTLGTKQVLTKEELQSSIQSMKRRKQQVKNNYFRPKQWVKTPQGWKYQRQHIHLSKFRKEYLQTYFDKHIDETRKLLQKLY